MEGGSGSSNTMLPPGFRFHPTDEELFNCYLIGKISNPNSEGFGVLVDVDLNSCEPWDLPGKAKIGENEWYFFSRRDRKYPTGVRTNRATKTGYWKTTGKDKEVFNSDTHELIGMKKTLVFYIGRAPRGEKTNWVMHEFRLYSKPTFYSVKDEWVICRVFEKCGTAKKYGSNHNLEIGPFFENLQSPEWGSSSPYGSNMNTNTAMEAVIHDLKLPQALPFNNAASFNAGIPFTEMSLTEEPNIVSGYMGFENSLDPQTYWTSFLLN